MAEAIDAPDEMSPYAPRITTVKIPVDKIGEVIGPKGKMINAIQDETGADISIEDDGTIYVGATDGPSAEAAVDGSTRSPTRRCPKVGERFLGTVVKTAAFGAFVSLLPGQGRPAAHLQGWAAASGSRRSRTSSTSATRSRSRSPRSTTAARSRWTRSEGARRRGGDPPARRTEPLASARVPTVAT
jgi:polyribonucleotide nucleotidyltransferase